MRQAEALAGAPCSTSVRLIPPGGIVGAGGAQPASPASSRTRQGSRTTKARRARRRRPFRNVTDQVLYRQYIRARRRVEFGRVHGHRQQAVIADRTGELDEPII